MLKVQCPICRIQFRKGLPPGKHAVSRCEVPGCKRRYVDVADKKNVVAMWEPYHGTKDQPADGR